MSAAYEKKQPLTSKEEKSILRLCETLDDVEYPLQAKMIKVSVMSLLSSYQ